MRPLIPRLLLILTSMASWSAMAEIADVAAGARRAAVCFACHGENGIAAVPGTPHLAGQDRRYLESALKSYRTGSRQDPTMAAMAKPLSDVDIVNIAAYFHLARSVPPTESLADVLALQRRIAPVGAVLVAAAGQAPVTAVPTAPTAGTAAAPTAPRTGQAIYERTCSACHGSGIAGAPRFGDATAWTPRLAQGKQPLYLHSVQGLNAMPPRGSCMDCSEDELHRAVDYLIGEHQK